MRLIFERLESRLEFQVYSADLIMTKNEKSEDIVRLMFSFYDPAQAKRFTEETGIEVKLPGSAKIEKKLGEPWLHMSPPKGYEHIKSLDQKYWIVRIKEDEAPS